MARGVGPRQPAKTGRHEGTRGRRVGKMLARTEAHVPRRADQKAGSAATAKKKAAAKNYNPVAPERVGEILQRLDQLYPGVTCALTHSSAW